MNPEDPVKNSVIREIRAKKKEKSVILNPNNDNKESLTPHFRKRWATSCKVTGRDV